MGFFRGGIVFILGVLLFISFLALNSFFILESSLKYDNVKESLYPLVKNLSESGTAGLIQEQVLGDFNLTKVARDNVDKIKSYCQNNTEYLFSYEGYVVSIPCYANATDIDVVINETFNDVIYDIYYKKYDCKFWGCFVKTQLPFFLVSQKARDYWKGKFYISLIASLILILLIFLFIEEKRNTPIVVGVLLVLSSISILKLEDVAYFFARSFSALIKIFLSNTQKVFVLSFALGILLILAGIVLRILGSNYMKEKFSKKDIKEIVKEEITQEKQKQKDTKGKKKK